MNVTDDFSALRAQLDALPEWDPASLDPRRSLVLSIDLNQGFTRMGALSSPRVAGIIPETAAFLRRCRELGLPIAAVTDCHKPGTEEFRSYPAHCLEGTPESELVEEIREFPETVIRKNSTNAFFAPGMDELLRGVETVVVTGCCTDIRPHPESRLEPGGPACGDHRPPAAGGDLRRSRPQRGAHGRGRPGLHAGKRRPGRQLSRRIKEQPI